MLQSYLHGWLPALGTWTGRLLFIDGFAGPGEYATGEDGSPVIALKAFLEHRARATIRSEMRFFFIESDQQRARHLSNILRTGGRNLPHPLPSTCRATVVTGKFDATMTNVLDRLRDSKARMAPAFVMIDPFGVAGTPMAVVERLFEHPRCEVYISFMCDALNRFKDSAEFADHLDALFGCPDWRKHQTIPDPNERKLFFYDLYASQLRAAGARYVLRFELYEQRRLVYAIFFGTCHLLGTDLMKRAIWRVAPLGDFAFHGTRTPALRLEAVPDFAALRKALQDEFRGKGWVRIEEVMDFVASDRTGFHKGQVKRPVLVPMEDAGEIDVARPTGKKRHSFTTGTGLRFL